MTHHILKADPQSFQACWDSLKPWEIRLDDRNYKVQDQVTIKETKYSGAQMALRPAGNAPHPYPLEYTGREMSGWVRYKLTGYGLTPGWCILTVQWEDQVIIK